MITPQTRCAPLPQPNPGPPGFGRFEDLPEAGKPAAGWGGVGGGGRAILAQAPPLSHRATPTPPASAALRRATLPTRGRVGPSSPLALIPLLSTRPNERFVLRGANVPLTIAAYLI